MDNKKTSSAEDSISNLENALVRARTSISPINKKRLLKIVSTTHYSTRRIMKFIKNHPQNLSDVLDCLEISSKYRAGLKNIENLLNVGYSTPQIQDLMELREGILSLNPKPREIWDGEEYKSIPPDLSEYVSYQNLIFLDEMAGGTHDAEEIRMLIEQIEERVEMVYERSGILQEGISIILHRMRQINESQKSERGYISSFNMLLNSALCYIPEESYEGRED